jgi:hypothetical protein
VEAKQAANGDSLRVKPTFEEVYVPAKQGFAGAPKEIEKELFTPHMKTVCSTVM